MPPKKQRYVKMDPIQHVLARGDMYVGSSRPRDVEDFVVVDDVYHIAKRTISISPAILRIFIEPLSNAIDNLARSKESGTKMTKISININEETGETSVWNDGDVIPIELHPEEKCYNHSMIFGQLLTGSNYNDEDDRLDIAGRNGLGIKLCLKAGTQLPKFSGEISKIEDVQIGDYLIGDDGQPRKVLGKVEGSGKLYEVSQPRGQSYIVNENHILTLCMPDHKVIFWNTTENGWTALWLDAKRKKICKKTFKVGNVPKLDCEKCGQSLTGNLKRHYTRIHPDATVPKRRRLSPTIVAPATDDVKIARKKMEEFLSSIPDDNTMDINIQEYMNLNKTTQARLSGFFGKCVEWKERKVLLDPYVLGLWLGDGGKNGHVFAINSEKDPEILDYLTRWGMKNDATFKQGLNQPIYFSISSTSKSRVAPLKKLLLHYDLVNNKHIPREYLVNSRKVRLSVLAGLIDSDGCVTSDGRRITIVQGMLHTKLASDIVFLAKSLGFMCSNHIKKTQWDYHGELRRGTAVVINISGNGVEDIPTLVPRKRCSPPLKREVINSGKLQIREVEAGDYVGLEVDGNHRFVLEDFSVTHNCNVFSKSFTVEGVDPVNKKMFKQTWKNNMTDVGEPVVIASKQSKGYTKVTYTPDFTRFGLENYTADILALYKRYVTDAAMITKLNVTYNDEQVPVEILVDYAKLYSPVDLTEYLFVKTSDCEIVLTPSNDFEAISFANGVCTSLGGTHVDAWSEAIFRPLIKKLNKKGKPQVNIGDVKKFFRLFVVATVKKPEFDSQSKLRLEGPIIEAEIKKSHIATISKWSVMEKLEDMIRFKEMVVLKKTERKKRGHEHVEGLDPANNEGGTKGRECSLILVEGLSAKTYASGGIQEGAFGKKGRDWFGIMALRGKVLNCRNASPAIIAKNKVVTDIIKALGVQYGLDYTDDDNFKKLRYGRILIITDADVDGIHISALIQNMFHALFPSLLKREEPFITAMQTPIVRVYGKPDKIFYDEQEYFKYIASIGGKKIDKKYYKGLGTSNEDEVSETFAKKLIKFTDDDKCFDSMNKAFHKKYSDMRKTWLLSFDPENTVLKWKGNKEEELPITFSEFIDTELIKFSIDNCSRSIPSLMDGFKQGHRKVLFTCFKHKNLGYKGKTMKVAQIAGLVAFDTAYHHGEQILYNTITGMANAFVGSNNIPFLFRDGQFGSRAEGGKDAANGRYILSKLDALTRLIFHPDDDVLLEYAEDDGKKVEPKYYVPIIPTILVNGCIVGIATGWSCNVPCYNPLDLVDSIKVWLDHDGKVFTNDDDVSVSLLPELKPWYRGHTGEITYDGKRFISWGKMERNGDKVRVTELPVGYWTSDFTDKLEKMKEEKEIANYKNHSNPKTVDFTVIEHKDGIECNENNLGLYTYIHTTNMVLFSEQGTLKRFDTVNEIIDSYCQIRYMFYTKRKNHKLNELDREIKLMGNKKRFLEEVRDGELKLFTLQGGKRQSRKTKDIVIELEEKGYDKDIRDDEEKDGEESGEEEEEEVKKKRSGHGYEYLLRMQISSITAEKIEKLKKDIASRIEDKTTLQGTTEKELWLRDLDAFVDAYTPWLDKIAKEKVPKKKAKKE